MTIHGRNYNFPVYLRAGEDKIGGDVLITRSKEMSANLGREDGEHILRYQKEIPVVFRGKVILAFTEWRHPEKPSHLAFVFWGGECWVQDWNWGSKGIRWPRETRLPRRAP